MSNKFIFIIMGIAVAGIVIMGILYYVLQKKMQKLEEEKESIKDQYLAKFL